MFLAFLLFALPLFTDAKKDERTKIVLTNDDGWAVAQIRSEYAAFKKAGYKVILSAPAQDKSGTGSSTAPPTTLTIPCEYDSCPVGSPAEGFNASDPFLNYVNSFPVDSVRYGIQTLAPKLFHSNPDLIFSGVNVGNNLGPIVNISGTVGAATEAAREGFPSIALSGVSNAHVSYTTLESDPTNSTSIAAGIYTELSLKFVKVLLDNPKPLMPLNTSININYPATTNCTVKNTKFIFTRLLVDPTAKDVHTCGSETLPDENSTIALGCYATVSVFDARNKGDVPADLQAAVLKNIKPILSCLPKSK